MLAPLLPLRAALVPLALVEDGRSRAVIVVPEDGLPPDQVPARREGRSRAHRRDGDSGIGGLPAKGHRRGDSDPA
jgi:hypothetical protein